MKRVLVGMSGGVDSAATVLLLQDLGYDVTGVTLRLAHNEQGIADACAAAEKMHVPHVILPLTDAFQACVMQPFIEAYAKGETPNPCVLCNQAVKFAALSQYADARGFDYIATGHYARVQDGRLYRAADKKKDQSYFLYGLDNACLSRLLLPLGDYTKPQVREIAARALLPQADKPDSLEICFIPDNDYAAFIEKHLPQIAHEGKILNENGEMVGIHNGVHHYTVGQRKGLGAFGQKVFVTRIDAAANTVTIGTHADTLRRGLTADTLVWHAPFAPSPGITAKIRSAAPPVPVCVTILADGRAQVEFETMQRAVTPGQAVVFYQENLVLGGGRIATAF